MAPADPPGPEPVAPLGVRLADRIRAEGPLGYADWVEACLYDPDAGFYAGGGSAGRRGDFLTSPEVGPLFGAVLARWLDDRWEALGRPEGFTVVEAAAGVGTLARTVLAAEPACLAAGRYVMVERSSTLRAAQPVGDGLASVADLSEVEPIGAGAVLANELLDNLAFDLLEHDGSAWRRVLVDIGDGGFVEVLGAEAEPPAAHSPVTRPASVAGARIPVQDEARRWVEAALDLVARGSVLVVDYASTTPAMADRPVDGWLRTYRDHERGGPPTDAPGSQDVTVEVAVDQLPAGAATCTQAELLRRHGIDDLVEAGRRLWEERAHLGDLEAMRARSRIAESEALLDPEGLGGFTVLEWTLGGAVGS